MGKQGLLIPGLPIQKVVHASIDSEIKSRMFIGNLIMPIYGFNSVLSEGLLRELTAVFGYCCLVESSLIPHDLVLEFVN